MRSPRRLILTCLLISLALAGCKPAGTQAERARADDMLLMSAGPEPPTLDPHLNTGAAAAFIINALWEPLVEWNDDATGVVPAAAARWDISADGRTYTFHLRPEARWSNGDPVTAHEWVRSLQRWLTPSFGAELANQADPILGATDFRLGRTTDWNTVGIRAPDDHTLVIELTEPYPGFVDWLCSYPWVPVHLSSLAETGAIDDPLNPFLKPGRLITNGAFVLTEWRHDQYVEVERNPHFHDPARLRAIRFYAMDNLDTMERAFRGGQLHLTDGVPPAKIIAYQEAQDPVLSIKPRVGLQYFSFNTRQPPFDDPRVRRALSLALDRAQLTDAVLRNGSPPAYSVIKPLAGVYEPTIALRESVDEARALLAEAGYPDGQGFPTVEYLFNSSDLNRTVAEALQQMWRTALNIDIKPRNEDWKVFLDTRHRGDYQIARSGWLPFTTQPAELYALMSTPSPSNETGWSNAEYDRLLEQAMHTLDPAERRACFAAMDVILRDEMPVIPMAYYSRARLIDPAIDGWPRNPLEAFVWQDIGFAPAP